MHGTDDAFDRERHGASTFGALSLARFVSLIGSSLSGFGFGVWTYEQTRSVTMLSLIHLSSLVPGLLFSFFVGATAIDRFPARRVFVVCDLVALSCVGALLALSRTGQLRIWHLPPILAVLSISVSLQVPLSMTLTSAALPPRHLNRAAAITQMVSVGPMLIAPLLGGWMVTAHGIDLMLLIDIASYAFAILVALVIRLPQRETEPQEGRGIWENTREGWRYVAERSGLAALLLTGTALNFASSMVETLMPAMVLDVATAKDLGMVVTAAGCGYLVGSLSMAVTGGFTQRARGTAIAQALLGIVLMCAGFPFSLPLLGMLSFGVAFFMSIHGTCAQALWMKEVPEIFQARVFTAQHTVSEVALPTAYLITGLLADLVFRPILLSNGVLAPSVGALFGVGPGRGFAFVLFAAGVLLLWMAPPTYRRLRAFDHKDGSESIAPS